MNEKEIRFQTSSPLEIRAAEESPGILTGYAAVYNSITEIGSYFREVIRPGAFTRAIRDNQDVRALWNHESGIVLGRRSAGTLSISEDERGLKFELTLPDTTAGRDAAVSVKRGDISGMSFGFQVVTARWLEEADEDTELRELLDLDLIEVSPVTFPAYADTEVGVRSRDKFRAERSASNPTRNASSPLSIERERQEMRKIKHT